MKYKISITIAALLSATSSWADTLPYYHIDILTLETVDSNNGPFASAISENGVVGVYATKAVIDQNVDVGLPYTFNQVCFFDDVVCELLYSGNTEDSSDLSHDNAYKAWRVATAKMDQGDLTPESYFKGAAYFIDEVDGVGVQGFGEGTDVAITDVAEIDGTSLVVGYGSAPYVDVDGEREREFVRRGFITDLNDSTKLVSLKPDFATNGGFTSAYKMRNVTSGETTKTLIIGSSSKSLAGGDSTYFNRCYNGGDDSGADRDNLGYLVYCPGFDTQAWAWEYDSSAETLTGFALATEWLDGNTDRDGSDATYSAAALDINASGIAVGVSSYEHSNDEEGARQRAIIMTPKSDGTYGEPKQLTEATKDISNQNDNIYNTWAKTITNDNVVMGNRQYTATKNRNKPNEMFIYNIDNDAISFPLLNKKVLSTKQRLAGSSASFNGSNSQGYAMNENDLIVGQADAYDQTDPTVGAIFRTQSAFLYDNASEESWFIDDLLCTETVEEVVEGESVTTVSHPLIRLESATAINDAGVVLAQGYQYDSISDYQNEKNPTAILVKLTPNSNLTPDESPNCWDSEALATDDSGYSRSGAASFWLWIFALPLLLVRRIAAYKK